MIFNHSLNINADINTVFSYLSELEKQKLWIQGLIDIQELPKEDGKDGKPFLIKIKEGVKINSYKSYTLKETKPTYLNLLVEDSKFFLEIHYNLRRITDNSTNLEYKCIIHSKRILFKVLIAVFSPITLIKMKVQFNKLKQLAEDEFKPI